MISIIIPTKNEETVLEATLRNLVDGLKDTPHEIIVSDGGSSDSTEAIARRYAKRFVAHAGEKKQTIGQGKNAGAREASGDFLVFIDADVIVPSPDDFFRKALENFERDFCLVGLGCRIRVAPELEKFSDRFFRSLHNSYGIFMNNVLRFGTGSGEFQMIRKEAFNRVGGFDENIAASEDHEIFMRLARLGRTRFDSVLTVYEKGRRAKALGWPRLFGLWILNGFAVTFFKRSMSREWKEIR